MRFSLSRLSVTYQFILLAALGVILTVMAVFLTLQRTFDFAYTLKHQESGTRPRKARRSCANMCNWRNPVR
jgi:hypothetical protein